MKLKSIATSTLLALAGSALVASPLLAGTVSYNPGDLLLGFRAAADPGATKDYLVNLGAASGFTGSTVRQFDLGSISLDLAATFGANWASRGEVLWSVSGTSGSTGAGTDPVRTLYVTTERNAPGTQSSARLTDNSSAQAAPSNKLAAVGAAYVQKAGVPNSSTANSSVGVLQDTTDANSYASFQVGGISYSYFSPSTEGTFAHGTAGSVLDLYRLAPTASPVAGDYLGRFVLNDSGVLTFVPVAAFDVNTVQLAAATYSVVETAGKVTVTVTRTGDTSSATSVTLTTTDGTANSTEDYTALSAQTVSFGINQVSKTVDITIANRTGFQPSRDFTVALGGASGGTTLGSTSSATVTITEPVVASVIALDPATPVYSVNQNATSVTINLVRTVGGSPVSADLATTDGTAHAGTDFTAPAGAAATVSFAANINTGSATVTLAGLSGVQPNKQFTVSLTNPSTNASVTAGTVTVRIIADDNLAPTLTVTAPAAAATINGVFHGTAQLTGTFSDNKGAVFAQVLYRLNGDTETAATISNAGTGYSATITPVRGLNTVVVRAVDGKGNASAPITRTFTYVAKATLNVPTPSGGTVTGKLAPTVANPLPYVVGSTYTLTAVPAANKVLGAWTVPGLTGAATEVKVLSFVFTEALALSPSISVTFITNPFATAVIGDFDGLITAKTPTVPSNSTNGFIHVNVTGAGTFTGTVKIDSLALPITGVLDNAGVARFGPTRATSVLLARPLKPFLELAFTVHLGTDNKLVGTLTERVRNTVTAVSDVKGDRAAFSAATPFTNALYLDSNGLKGTYTVVLPSKAQTNGLLLSEYPQGDSIGTLSITKAGLVTFIGKLADGAAVTASALLSKTLTSPLFAQLYVNKAGSLGGLITLNAALATSDLSGADFTWFRPWADTQHYPYGWPEGIQVDLRGAKYASAAGLPGLAGLTSPNALLDFSDGLLSAAISTTAQVSTTNAVTLLPTGYTVTIATATGLISGSFVHEDLTKPKFNAVILQKDTTGSPGPLARAFGFFLSSTPKPFDYLGESGRVSLKHK